VKHDHAGLPETIDMRHEVCCKQFPKKVDHISLGLARTTGDRT
jgi:hypothetical protein